MIFIQEAVQAAVFDGAPPSFFCIRGNPDGPESGLKLLRLFLMEIYESLGRPLTSLHCGSLGWLRSFCL